jgi:hypothetical protein
MHAHSSLDLMLFRSGLGSAQEIPDVADLMALGELCLAHGAREQARMLYETVFILQGSSRQARAVQARIAQGTGLWDTDPFVATEAPASPGASTIEIAVAELEEFAPLLTERQRGRSPLPVPAVQPGSIGSLLGDLPGIASRLHAFLGEPAPADGWQAADRLLQQIRAIAFEGAALDHRGFHAAPLPLLAAVMSFVCLREFVLANHELVSRGSGSAEILHRAARFDSAGLGPYLGNITQIAKRSRDLFELAGIAAAAAGSGDTADIHRWVVILSQHLRPEVRNEVIDDLGDLAASSALNAFYDRAVRQPDHRIELPLVFRVRDAAIDIGDLELARRAQSLVARLRPDQALERMILGSIEATAGLLRAAEENFLECLRMSPDFTEATERLTALRRHAFDDYRVLEGFGTPPDRALFRHGRRHRGCRTVRTSPRGATAVDL